MLTSTETQEELRRVLAKPYFKSIATDSIKRYVEVVFSESELIIITELVAACRDPMDDKFLELAMSGKADVIVSGDKDLLSMTAYKGTHIVTPADFLILYAN